MISLSLQRSAYFIKKHLKYSGTGFGLGLGLGLWPRGARLATRGAFGHAGRVWPRCANDAVINKLIAVRVACA